MNVNSKNYDEAIERRDEIEDLINRANGIVSHLLDMYNELEDGIKQYDQEQHVLDQ